MSPREIDALVAEHCMGWIWMQGTRNNNLLRPEHVRHGVAMGMWSGRNSERETTVADEDLFQLPRYSTDPAASKQLRDKMRADGWACSVATGPNRTTTTFIRIEGAPHWASSHDPEKELECTSLAALSAVGKPVKP